jgi:hypothetical protein
MILLFCVELTPSGAKGGRTRSAGRGTILPQPKLTRLTQPEVLRGSLGEECRLGKRRLQIAVSGLEL